MFAPCCGAETSSRQALSTWLGQLALRAQTNIVAVALAKKLALVAWAMLFKRGGTSPSAACRPS
jgi:hypothetical protein